MRLVSVALLLAASLSANAAIIDNGAFTTDTDTSLDWLDLTATAGRSYTDVTGEFGSGGDFEGWRVATGLELTQLFTNWYGIGPTSSLFGGAIWEFAQPVGSPVQPEIISYFGNNDPGVVPASAGMISDPGFPVDSVWYASVVDYSSPAFDDFDDRTSIHQGFADINTATNFGTFLIRDSAAEVVPEPHLFGLMLVTAGLLVHRRRRVGSPI